MKKQTRRRGANLEAELLDAAWAELTSVGYANLTMESVAARARTGVAVLYRRWPGKAQVALAALERYRLAHPVPVPDTGSLRGDLLAQLEALNDGLAGYLALAAATAFSGLLADTGMTPAQARKQLLAAQRLPKVRVIYQRAHDRGELNLKKVSPTVLALPFDLLRHDLLLTLKPVKRARFVAIVDELFFPLLATRPVQRAS